MAGTKTKRLDLQGIPGLAIIVVIGFHFFPEHCPNGYLGVDQFFVLSGFLMCMLLKRAENQSPCSLVRCEPLFPTVGSVYAKTCKKNFTDFEERIREEKPDYAFIVTRHISVSAPFSKNSRNMNENPTYRKMKKQIMKFLSNIKYKLYFLNAIPCVDREMIKEIFPMIMNNTDFEKIDNVLVRGDHYERARDRYARLVKDCKRKCILVDYLPEFYNNSTKTLRYFDDRGFSYWTDPLHLSPHAIEHIRNVWTGKL